MSAWALGCAPAALGPPLQRAAAARRRSTVCFRRCYRHEWQPHSLPAAAWKPGDTAGVRSRWEWPHWRAPGLLEAGVVLWQLTRAITMLRRHAPAARRPGRRCTALGRPGGPAAGWRACSPLRPRKGCETGMLVPLPAGRGGQARMRARPPAAGPRAAPALPAARTLARILAALLHVSERKEGEARGGRQAKTRAQEWAGKLPQPR